MAVATKGVTLQDLDRAMAEESFAHFLNFVKVQKRYVGTIPFEKHPHLQALARVLPVQELMALGKSRKIGATWILAAYCTWAAGYGKATSCAMMGKKENPDAVDFLAKCRFIWDNLPPHIQSPLDGSGNMTEMKFRNGNRIIAMPSSAGGARGYNEFSIFVLDEADFHPYLEENFGALMPIVEGGGQLFLVSTSNPFTSDSRWKNIMRNATVLDELAYQEDFKPVRGWATLFFGWAVWPGRGEDFLAREQAESGLTDFEMEKEFPSTREEMLAPSRSAMFFDRNAVTELLRDVLSPIEERLGSAVKIWRKPSVTGRYVAFADCAWGEKGAYDCCVIVDYQTGEQMAEVYGRLTDPEMAKLIYETCTTYNKAYLGVEANGEGINVVNLLIELGYGDRMFHRGEDWRREKKDRGWWTGPDNRPYMLGDFAQAVKDGHVRIHCKDAVKEMFTFIRNEKGKPVPADGAYSDHVISLAGAWQMRIHARFTSAPTGKVAVMPRRF